MSKLLQNPENDFYQFPGVIHADSLAGLQKKRLSFNNILDKILKERDFREKL